MIAGGQVEQIGNRCGIVAFFGRIYVAADDVATERFEALGEGSLQAITPFGVGYQHQRVISALGERIVGDLYGFVFRAQTELIQVEARFILVVAVVQS